MAKRYVPLLASIPIKQEKHTAPSHLSAQRPPGHSSALFEDQSSWGKTACLQVLGNWKFPWLSVVLNGRGSLPPCVCVWGGPGGWSWYSLICIFFQHLHPHINMPHAPDTVRMKQTCRKCECIRSDDIRLQRACSQIIALWWYTCSCSSKKIKNKKAEEKRVTWKRLSSH